MISEEEKKKRKKEYNRRFREKNPGYHKKYDERRREKKRQYDRERYNNNPDFRNSELERSRKRYDKNKEYFRNNFHTNKYGISIEDRDSLLKKQGGVCAICKSSDAGGRDWHTDHCHKTGTVRGVLCCQCNHLLGNARDNEEILLSAIEYLHGSKR